MMGAHTCTGPGTLFPKLFQTVLCWVPGVPESSMVRCPCASSRAFVGSRRQHAYRASGTESEAGNSLADPGPATLCAP